MQIKIYCQNLKSTSMTPALRQFDVSDDAISQKISQLVFLYFIKYLIAVAEE